MDYLDTSVLAAYYCPEPRSARVQRLLSRVVDPAISTLVEVELYCAVARKVRAGELDAPIARRLFTLFQQHVAEPRFRVLPLRAAEFGRARDWIAQLASPLRVLDAIHLAAAFAHGACLLTADEALARSAGHFGVKCRLV